MIQTDRSHVRILVRTPVNGEYPPEEWESLWATALGGNLFKIDNIPFYAKNLSCDDVVEAVREAGEYHLNRVVNFSNNSTIRVVIYDLEYENFVRSHLISLGSSIEGTGITGLLAVNIPRE